MKNSKFKKILTASVIMVALVLSTVIGSVVVLKNRKSTSGPASLDVWDGVTTIRPTGDGCADDPFIIENGANLAYVAQEMDLSNAYYYTVVKDIDLGGHDWTPIGDVGDSFSGNFYGNGYTISNIGVAKDGYYNADRQAPSLFGNVWSATIDGVFTKYSFKKAKGTETFGGIARQVSNYTYISNCASLTESISFANVDAEEFEVGIGGIVGFARYRLSIKNSFSVTNLTLSGTNGAVGGLVGRYYVGGENTIENSYSAGKIVATENDNVSAGNIVGDGLQSIGGFYKVSLTNTYSTYDNKGDETNPNDKWSTLISSGNWVVDPSVNNGMPTLKVESYSNVGVSTPSCAIDYTYKKCKYGGTFDATTNTCTHYTLENASTATNETYTSVCAGCDKPLEVSWNVKYIVKEYKTVNKYTVSYSSYSDSDGPHYSYYYKRSSSGDPTYNRIAAEQDLGKQYVSTSTSAFTKTFSDYLTASPTNGSSQSVYCSVSVTIPQGCTNVNHKTSHYVIYHVSNESVLQSVPEVDFSYSTDGWQVAWMRKNSDGIYDDPSSTYSSGKEKMAALTYSGSLESIYLTDYNTGKHVFFDATYIDWIKEGSTLWVPDLRDGYQFNGWKFTYYTTNGGQRSGVSGTGVITTTCPIEAIAASGAYVFEASISKVITVTVKNVGGTGGPGTISNGVQTFTTIANSYPTTAMAVPTLFGWTFNGYYYNVESSDGSGNDEECFICTENGTYVEDSGGIHTWPSDDVTIYASWTRNSHTISYNLNSGSYGSSHPDTAKYGIGFTVSNPTRSGYVFSGWKITGMDSYTHYYGDSSSSYSTTAATSITSTKSTWFKNLRSTSGQVTFTAVWTAQSENTISVSAATGLTYGSTSNMVSVSNAQGSVYYSVGTSLTSSNYSSSGSTTIPTASGRNAGTYTVYYYCVGNTNYKAKSGSVSVTIGKASISPTVSMSGYTYGGTKSTPSISGNTGGGTVTYYYNTSNSTSGGTNWSNVTGAFSLTADTYYMYAIVAATTNYYGATTSTTSFVVSKSSISPTVSMSGYTYGGTKSTPSISGNHGSGTVTYYYNTTNSTSGGTLWSKVTSSTYLSAGTYYMYAVVAETTNFKGGTTSTKSFVISKASISPTVSMSNYTYAGTKSTPSVSGNSGGGSVTYYYNTTNSASGGTAWTNVTSSTYLNAGTYYMYAVVGATTNYYSATTSTKSFVISKASISPTVSMSNYTYAGTKSTPSISGNSGGGSVTYYYNTTNSASGGTAWTNVTSSTYLSAGTYYMYAVVGATTNYNGTTTSTKSFVISKASISPTVSMSGYTYGGTKSTPSISGNSGSGTVTYYYNTSNSTSGGTAWTNVTSSTYLNAGTYYMYATVAATTNYNGATTSTKSFTISKATLSDGGYGGSKIITVTPYSGTYDGNAHYATIKSTIAGVKVVSGTSTSYGNTAVSSATANTSYNLLPSRTDYGTTTIYYKVSGFTNYNDYTGTTTVTIGKATMSAPTVSVSTAGVVTWGSITGATSYQINMDNSDWTNAISVGNVTSYDYNDKICKASGSRTVYVRATTSNSNYNTYGSVGSNTVTVYQLTVNYGTYWDDSVHTTKLNVSASGCILSTTSIGYGGSCAIRHISSTTAINVTVTRSNTSYTYYMEYYIGSVYTYVRNTFTCTWTPSADAELGVAVIELFNVSAVCGTGAASATYAVKWGASASFSGAITSRTEYQGTGIQFTTTGKAGYSFKGWYDNANGTGTAKSTSTTYTYCDYGNAGATTRNAGLRANVTLYAIWTINTYTLTANANGGTYKENLVYNLVDKGSASSPITSGSIKYYVSGGVLHAESVGTGNDLYGHTEIKANLTAGHTYTFNFKAMSTNSSVASTVDIGWFLDNGYTAYRFYAGFSTKYNVATQHTINITDVTATGTYWMRVDPNVTNAKVDFYDFELIDNAASSVSSATYTGTYTDVKALSKPTRGGYTFAGWLPTGSNYTSYPNSMPGTLSSFGYAMFDSADLSSSIPSRLGVYNNNGNGTVTHTRVSDTTNPTGSGYSLKIVTNGSASPSAGGFCHEFTPTAGETYYQVIWAKIPVGYTLYSARNAAGDGATDMFYDFDTKTWTTNGCAGTGEWKLYIYRLVAGTSGSFSSCGHKYVAGSNNTSVTWYVGYAQVFRVAKDTKTSVVVGTGDLNGTIYQFGLKNNKVVAGWAANKYTVTFNANGGTSVGEQNYYTSTSSQTKTLTSPTRTGYTFAGWTISTNSSGATSTISGSTLTIPANAYGNITLTAKWTPITYYIAYNGNGNNIGGSTATSTHTYDTAKALTSNGFTKTGYSFAGWATSASGSVAYSNGASVKNLSSTQGATVTLYAKWNVNNYTVSYNANGGSVSPTSKSVTYDSTYGDLPTPTRSGYTFKGWYFSSAGQSTYTLSASTGNYNYQEVVTRGNVKSGVTYYLHIDKATLTSGSATSFTVLLYDFAANSALLNKTASFGTNIDMELVCPTSSSSKLAIIIYAGLAGSTANNAVTYTGVSVIASNATAISSSTQVTTASNHALYAQWELIPYTITLNPNGGSVEWTSKTYYVTTSTITLPTATRNGYTFTGWTGSNGTTPQKTVTIATGSTGNKSYTANWSANNVTLTVTPTSLSMAYGESKTFSYKSDVAGTFTITSSNTSVVTVTSYTQNASAGTSYDCTVKGVGVGSATITVAFKPTGNYLTPSNKTVSVTVGKATLSDGGYGGSKIITVTPYSGTYDGSAHYATIKSTIAGVTIVSGTSTSYGNTIASSATANTSYNLLPSRTDYGTTTIYYKVSGFANYNDYTGTTTVTISKANMPSNIITVTSYSGTYDGNAHYATIKSTIAGVTVVSGTSTSYGNTAVSSATANTSYNLLPGRTDNGTTTVYYKVSGFTNYNDYTGTTTVSIGNATIKVSASDYTGTYDGKAHSASITVSSPTGTTIKWGTASGSYTNELTTNSTTSAYSMGSLTNVGTTTIYYQVSKTNYTTVTGSVKITINKATLSTPSNLAWAAGTNSAMSKATWGASTCGGITTTYSVTLYRGTTSVKTITTTNTYYDFSADLKSDALTNGGNTYSFTVQATSSNTANCANSAVSSKSGTTAVRLVTVSISSGINSVTYLGSSVANGAKFASIYGESGAIVVSAKTGWTLDSTKWATSSSDMTIASTTTASTTLAHKTSGTAAVTLTAKTAKLNAPTVSVTPTSSTIMYAKDSATLTGTASHTATGVTYTYQWHRSTTSGFTPSTSTAISNATSNKYTHASTTTSVGTYYYKLVVVASSSSVTSTATSSQVTVVVNANTETTVSVTATNMVYTGEVRTTTLTVKIGSTGMSNYSVTGNTGTNVGKYTVTVTINSGNYQGSKGTATWIIHYPKLTVKGAEGSTVTADQAAYPEYNTKNMYDGETSSTAKTLSIPAKTGYTFNGWYTATSGGTQILTNAGALASNWDKTSDLTVYPQFSINSYTLTINPNSGIYNSTTSNTTVTQNYNTTYTVANPTRSGYTFAGWTHSGSGSLSGTTYTFGAGAGTLTANWTANTYTVTANANGGTIPATTGWTVASDSKTATKTVTYDSTYGDLPTPTRTGYTFKGWFTATSGGSQVTSTTKVTTAGAHTLVAQWQANKITVNFNANGGSVTPTSKEVDYDSTYDDLPTATRAGYTFDGWYTAASGGTKVTSTTKVTTAANHTLYAHWIANTYKVTNGANYGSVTVATTGTFDSGLSISASASQIGYNFTISNIIVYSGTSTSGTKLATITGTSGTFTMTGKYYESVYVYATWTRTAKEYTVKTGANYGSVTVATKGTFDSGLSISASASQTGYGFAISSIIVYSGTSTSGTKLATITGTSGTFTMTDTYYDSIYIYATWTRTATPYTISYNLNGGSLETGKTNPASYTIETADFTLNNPTRNGYTFAGWTGSNGETPQTSVTIKKGSTGDKSYTANWSTVSYSISYNLNGGSLETGKTNPASYTIETADITLNNPTRNGYTFAGWTGSNGTTPQTTVTIKKGSTGDKSYTANWSTVSYTISYTLNGGSVSTTNPTSYTVETATFTLNNPTKPGYTFTGWTGSNGETPQTSVTIKQGSTGDKSYTANWSFDALTESSSNGYTGTYDGASHTIKFVASHGSGNTITYQWYKGSVATANAISKATSTTYSVKNVADSGTYVCRATVSDGTTTKTLDKTLTVSISQKALTDNTANVTTKYDGTAKTITISLSGFVTGESMSLGTIKYYTTDSYATETTQPSRTVAGTTNVYYKVTFANYATVTGHKTITINGTAPTLTLTAYSTVYSGKATSFPSGNVKITGVSGGTTPSGALSYEYKAQGGTYTSTAPTNAGTYTVKVTVAADSNYTSTSAETTLTITKSVITIAATTGYGEGGSKYIEVDYDGKVDVAKSKATLGTHYTITATGLVPSDGNQITINNFSAGLSKDVQYNTDGSVKGVSATARIDLKDTTNFAFNSVDSTATYFDLKINIKKMPLDLSAATITGVNATYTYTGSAITPTITLKRSVGGAETTLVLNTDYTVAYTSNTNVGTATITATGKGNFTGTKTAEFKIAQYDISKATVSDIADQTYTGSAITPAFTVTMNSKILTVNTDYTVEFTNNTNVGEATITLTGTGNFTGTKTVTFNILRQRTASATGKSLTYNGTEQTGVDYKNVDITGTIKATNQGSYTAKATPTSNYAWSNGEFEERTISWSIAKFDISKANVTAIANQTYTGSEIKKTTTVTVTLNGKSHTLTSEEIDYTYSNDTTNVGTVTVTITGKGNFTGSVVTTYDIIYKAITGTATITGTTQYGDTLTASVTDGLESATYSYQWQYATSSTGIWTNCAKGTSTQLILTAENVGVDKVVGNVFRIVITATGNYSGSLTSNATASVTAKALAWATKPTVENKVYDSNTTATISNHGSVSGVISGDTATLVTSSAKATFNNATVGTGKAIAFTGYSLTGKNSGNYTLAQPTGVTANITKLQVTVSAYGNYATDATNKTYISKEYDGSTEVIAKLDKGTHYSVSSSLANVSYTASYANANVQSVNNITATFTLSDTTNMEFATGGNVITLNGRITPIEKVVVWETATSYTYTGSAQEVKAYYTNLAGTKVYMDVTFVTFDGQSTTFKDAGTYTATATAKTSDTTNTNYTITNTTKTGIVINTKAITISWAGGPYTYNTKAQGPSYTSTGVVDSDSANVTFTSSNNSKTAVGNYTAKVEISGTRSFNYHITNDSYDWKIVAKQLAKPSITGTYIYTGAALTATLKDFDSTTMTVTGNSQTNAGKHTVTVALKDKANYTWADGKTTDVTLDWTIAKATNSTIKLSQNSISVKIGETKTLTVTVTYDGTHTATSVTTSGVESAYATITASTFNSKTSTISIVGVRTLANGTVTVTLPEDNNHTAVSANFALTVNNIQVTMQVVDKSGNGATTKQGKVSYDTYTTDGTNVFEVPFGESRDLTIAPNANYGWYYYEINGTKTFNTTSTNLTETKKVTLSNITENTTIKVYFAPTIVLSFKLIGDSNAMSDMKVLTGTRDTTLNQAMAYTFATSTGTYFATARVFADSDVYVSLGGTSNKAERTAHVVTGIKFGNTTILSGSEINVDVTAQAISVADQIEAGKSYEVVYTTQTATKLESSSKEGADYKLETDSKNEITDGSNRYILNDSTVNIKITVDDGYTFVGFETETGKMIYRNDTETFTNVTSTETEYTYSAKYSEEVARLTPKAFKNNKAEIASTVSNATGTLTHVESGLIYNVTSGTIVNTSLGVDIAMLQGEYKLEAKGCEVTITIVKDSGTQTITTNDTGNYTFTIDDSVTSINISISKPSTQTVSE